MKVGPFAYRDMGEVESVLQSKAINYRVIVDKETLREQEARLAERVMTFSSSFNPEFTFVEIHKSDMFKLEGALEKFGVVEPSTGEELFGIKTSEVAKRAVVKTDPLWVTIVKIGACLILFYFFARGEMHRSWHGRFW